MKYRFTNHPLEAGLYEPEGIYLSTPFDEPHRIIQFFGQFPEFYGQFDYNNTALRGHPGIDFEMEPGTALYAVDDGRVMEISNEAGGFERYVKMEHRWGESLYALLSTIEVEAGQRVKRNQLLAYSGANRLNVPPHLHFAIRTNPYNRLDGWGGFSDPLAYLNPENIQLPDDGETAASSMIYHPMVDEKPGMRRP